MDWRSFFPRLGPLTLTADRLQSSAVSASRLRQLEALARRLALPAAQRSPAQPLIGETLASYRGRGFEFEDNRPYRPGDEPRLLNWRLYARTGELYTKVFSEERRPQVFVLVDQRPGMRFATRGRLKSTLAAELAITRALLGKQQAHAIGGLLVNEDPRWLEPRLGDAALDELLAALGAPCPPQPFEQAVPTISNALQLLNQRLPHGSHLLLLSDFADLDSDRDQAVLHQLSANHNTQATQILDPVELTLPENGELTIAKPDGDYLAVGEADRHLRQRYAAAIEAQQASLQSLFKRCGIALSQLLTDQSLEDFLLRPREPAHAD